MRTVFRLILIIPIAIILGLVSGAGETVANTVVLNEAGEVVSTASRTTGGARQQSLCSHCLDVEQIENVHKQKDREGCGSTIGISDWHRDSAHRAC